MDNAPALLGLVFQHMVFIVLGLLILQLFVCYAVQTIADKLDLPASWLAWVPLLQLYPIVRSGSTSFVHFVVLVLSGVGAVIVGAILGPVGALLALGWGLWCLVFSVRLFWKVAENRGVSGWLGILGLIPGLGLLAYFYIAFHDGFVAPSKVGLVLGLLCYAPSAAQLRDAARLEEVGQQFGALAEASERGDQRATLQKMQEMMATLQGMEGFEAGAGPQAMSEVLDSLAGDEHQASRAAAGSVPRMARPAVEPTQLEPISEFFACPDATRERGAAPPEGYQRWCDRLDPALGTVRHGGYASWDQNGQLRETGTYRNGEREGVWTRWYASGGRQAQAEFQDGVQHGLLLTWDEFGRPQRVVQFQQGAPVGG